jgi:creatinine amidohydrolase
VTYWAYPDREVLNQMVLDPVIAPEGPIRDAADYRARFADGRIGSDPTQSKGVDGGKLVAASARALLNDAAAFFAEVAP